MGNEIDLTRFLAAQDGVYSEVTQELGEGNKRSHWMWFIFPQVQGLGHSEYARIYAIKSFSEAEAYVAHPVLGSRLRECSQLLVAASGLSAEQILGHTDAQKLRSSMTLFELAAPGETLFAEVLEKFYDGVPDAATETILARWGAQRPEAPGAGSAEG